MRDIKIAIVEDEKEMLENLASMFDLYTKETGTIFKLSLYSNSYDFLENAKDYFDIVYLDIKMPGMNGMELAKKIREKDENVMIIFVTSLSQYAIEGYEVRALDYVLKPVKYPEFKIKITRALENIVDKEEKSILLNDQNGGGLFKVNISLILYIETEGHTLIYHLKDKTYKKYQAMKDCEKDLKDYGFIRINTSYLVNRRYIKGIKNNSIVLFDETNLLISRPRVKEIKKEFKKL